MLPHPHRLRKRSDFQNLYQKGHVVKTRGLLLRWLANKTNKTRLAIAVPTSTAHSAVARNRIKRRVRSSVLLLLPEIKKGVDGSITVYNSDGVKDAVRLRKIICSMFKSAGLLHYEKNNS